MITVKGLRVAPISQTSARSFIVKKHYSGKFVNNSCLNFGVFHGGSLYGVMSFGSPMDKRKVLGLVRGTKWHEMLELNRMAFLDILPKNSESRCLSIAFRLIKKNYPYIKWVLSFSDACQCGDGAIYRASGFYLIGVNKNKTILETPKGELVANLVLTALWNTPKVKRITKELGVCHKKRSIKEWQELGLKKIPGYQNKIHTFSTP